MSDKVTPLSPEEQAAAQARVCMKCGRTEVGWRYNRCPACGDMADERTIATPEVYALELAELRATIRQQERERAEDTATLKAMNVSSVHELILNYEQVRSILASRAQRAERELAEARSLLSTAIQNWDESTDEQIEGLVMWLSLAATYHHFDKKFIASIVALLNDRAMLGRVATRASGSSGEPK